MDLVGRSMSEEILIEILKRLRVKSLLRFSCVSKVWCNLIADPYFVASHLQFHKKSPSPHLEALLCRNSKDFDYFRLTKTPKAVSEHLNFKFPWSPNPKLELRRRKAKEVVSILGHSNGVLCARETLLYLPSAAKAKRLMICNPVTRRFRILLETDTDRTIWDEKREAVSFGFLDDDFAYKVVRVIHDRESIYEDKVYERPWAEVYDSTSGSWRMVFVDIDLSRHRVSNGVYYPLDGCLYWVGRGFGERKRSTLFVSFELVEEQWHEILLPDDIVNDDDSDSDGEEVSVRIVGENVVMIFVKYWRNFRVWEMKKKGDKVCWTLAHNLDTRESPRGFGIDGKHLFSRRWNRLVVHDSENMNDTCFDFAEHSCMGNVVSDFVESLLLHDEESCIGNGYVRVIFPKGQESEEEFGDLSNMFDENLQI